MVGEQEGGPPEEEEEGRIIASCSQCDVMIQPPSITSCRQQQISQTSHVFFPTFMYPSPCTLFLPMCPITPPTTLLLSPYLSLPPFPSTPLVLLYNNTSCHSLAHPIDCSFTPVTFAHSLSFVFIHTTESHGVCFSSNPIDLLLLMQLEVGRGIG